MKFAFTATAALVLVALVFFLLPPVSPTLSVTNAAGVRMMVADNTAPALKLLLPGQPESDPGILVLFPEHVTGTPQGSTEPKHLYLSATRLPGSAPRWERHGSTLAYTLQLDGGVTMTASATLEEDGVRYRYQFTSTSDQGYDKIQAVTDPRMITALLHDVRLERTWVHHAEGFDLLASETPARLTMALDQWLPNRYRVPYSWPIDRDRVAQQPDGVTWYNKSRAVDEPFLATVSTDGKWIMATFAHDPGNVWTNPELTCQHADPQVSLPAGKTAVQDSKMLLLRGTLSDVLKKVQQQRAQMN